jgi:hypothetical protein
MLVTFHSKAWSNITMFGDVAVPLLRMMGHSGTVPGALLVADLPAALALLQQRLSVTTPNNDINPDIQADKNETDSAPSIGLSLRAWPLIQLLYAAIEQRCDVMWEEGALLV